MRQKQGLISHAFDDTGFTGRNLTDVRGNNRLKAMRDGRDLHGQIELFQSHMAMRFTKGRLGLKHV